MRTHFLIGTVLVLGGALLAQTAAPNAPLQVPAAPPAGSPEAAYEASVADEMQPSPSWRPDAEFFKNAHSACDNAKQPPSFAECFIAQMSKAGAPEEAVKFTQELYKKNGQVGIAGRTKRFGGFAMAWIIYPLRANDNNGVMFLNTDPNFLDVDDISTLDKTGLPKEALFQELIKEYPKLELSPADRSGGDRQVLLTRSYPGNNPGEERFLFSYPLVNGCRACGRPGYANYWWTFDANGKFLGAKLISVSRVPPPIKRARPKRPTAEPTPEETTPKAETPQAPQAGADTQGGPTPSLPTTSPSSH